MPLNTGDIAFVSFNSDGNDNLAFVTLVPIDAGTEIHFTDNEWTGSSFNTGESGFTWAASVAISAGTIVTIDNIGTGTISSNLGGVTFFSATNRGIANSTEIVYAYVGIPSTPTTFLTAISNNTLTGTTGGDTAATLNGTGLTVGVNAIELASRDVDADVAAYNGPRSGLTNLSDYRALINNPANWQTQDASGDQSADGIAPDLPFSTNPLTTSVSNPNVNLSVSSGTGSEAGQTVITATATASSTVSGDQTVSLNVGGTNITAGDYTLSNTVITIPNGATSGSVTFTVVEDTLTEGTEIANLSLSNPSAGITLGNTTSQSISILDNDGNASLVTTLTVPGNAMDLFPISGSPGGANINRLSIGSDFFYDYRTGFYYGLADRGPGGGTISFQTRVEKLALTIDPTTGAASGFQVVQTISFYIPAGTTLNGVTYTTDTPLNGLNPLNLNGSISALGASFDPEGLVVGANGNLFVSDEYGPSIYEFSPTGALIRAFTPPANLLPKTSDGTLDYVDGRPTITSGRQDNRGFEGLTISPDGTKLFAIFQDPLVNEGTSGSTNDGRYSRNVRIVRYDVATGQSDAQYIYQLESLSEINDRILGTTNDFGATAQGRNIGVSSIVAINNHELLVLERDNRGFGVDALVGGTTNVPVGSKRVFKIDLTGATDVSSISLSGTNTLPLGVNSVGKSLFLDIAAALQSAGQTIPEKIEGLALGPQLADGSFALLLATDNDFSVTQNGSNTQFDVYTDGTQQAINSAPPASGATLVPSYIYAFRTQPNALDVTPVFDFSIGNYSATEGNTAGFSANATVTVTRRGDLDSPNTVQLQLTDGTATGGTTLGDNSAVDYNNSLITVTFNPGETSKSVQIPISGDISYEANETVNLTLVNPSSGTLVGTRQPNAVLTILNDDPSPVAIHTIQGTGHRSTLIGTTVGNVQGVVTGIISTGSSRGFYMQDPNPDNDPGTSEGIFVFMGTTWTNPQGLVAGQSVQVAGRVDEFRPGGNANNLTTTEINTTVSGSSVTKIASIGTITPTILGASGRTIPTSVIEDDASNVETSGVFDPANDGIDFYESLEGMLVQINNPVATSPTNDFGEVWILVDNGANATSRTARGGSLINPTDFNPERIQIDDNLFNGETPEVNVGTQLGTIVGVVDYNFNNYEVLPTTAPTVVTPSPLTKEVTSLVGDANQLTVATFNVENLDPGDGAAKFNALASAIVNNLKSPDIISLEEIQDNNGPTNNGVVDASITYATLIQAIKDAGGPTYEYRQIDPVNNQDGGEPGGNIRVGFLFNPNRVGFVEGSLQRLTDPNPAEVDAFSGDDFASSRKPLVGTFTFNGQQVTVIGNHFNSKGGDQPLFGPNQPPTLTSTNQRDQQATIVKDYVQSILSTSANANVIVAGDLNDFEFSNALNILKSTGLNTLIETLPASERYTYNFEGNAQTLDHILVSGNLLNQLNGFDVVHINSEFVDQVSDHDPSVARFLFNSAPTALALTTTNIDENVLANTLVGTFMTTDLDPGNTFTYSLVTGVGDADNSKFTINNNQLQINLSPDFETQSSYSIRVRTIDQGGLSLDKTLTITVNNINEAPVNTVPGAQTATQDAFLVFSTANGNAISFQDIDAFSGVEQVKLSVNHGFLSLGSTNGLTIVNGSNNSAALTLQGTLGDLNNALNGLKFMPDVTAVLDQAATLTIETSDLGNTGAGGAKTDTDTISITVNPANLILGGSDNDILRGIAKANTIYGEAGNDKIYGNGGNDILLGEDGNDEIYGSAGNDYMDGGNGNDKIYAYGGTNTIYGRAGSDTIEVGSGINFIDAGLGNDSIILNGRLDTISLTRGNGLDTIYNYSAGSTRFNLAAGLTFSDLTIVQNGNNTLISAGTEKLASLVGVQAGSITSSHFMSVQLI